MKLCSQRLPQRTEENGSMPDYSKRENPKPDALFWSKEAACTAVTVKLGCDLGSLSD